MRHIPARPASLVLGLLLVSVLGWQAWAFVGDSVHQAGPSSGGGGAFGGDVFAITTIGDAVSATSTGGAFELREAWSRRVPTAALNRWFDDALEANPPPAPKGKRIKLRYITQASIRPPRFVVFGTRLDMLPKSYERYLVNGIRDKLGFDAVPVRVVLKSPKNPFQKD